VPRGSTLVGTPAMAPHLGPFDAATFSYRWAHPDPRVDRLQSEVAALVEQAARGGEDDGTPFASIHALARAAAGQPPAARPPPERLSMAAVPRLTEPWFC
jgi:hypothetical protein